MPCSCSNNNLKNHLRRSLRVLTSKIRKNLYRVPKRPHNKPLKCSETHTFSGHLLEAFSLRVSTIIVYCLQAIITRVAFPIGWWPLQIVIIKSTRATVLRKWQPKIHRAPTRTSQGSLICITLHAITSIIRLYRRASLITLGPILNKEGREIIRHWYRVASIIVIMPW